MLLAYLCNEENSCKKKKKKHTRWDSMVLSTVKGPFIRLQQALGLHMKSNADRITERWFYRVARLQEQEIYQRSVILANQWNLRYKNMKLVFIFYLFVYFRIYNCQWKSTSESDVTVSHRILNRSANVLLGLDAHYICFRNEAEGCLQSWRWILKWSVSNGHCGWWV